MTASTQLQKGDICYHKVYGYGEVLCVSKDDYNRLIVSAKFARGFQHMNYDHFMRTVTVYPAGVEHPVCPTCGLHPAVNGGPCFLCQAQPEVAPKKKAPENVGGYFSDGDMDREGDGLEEYSLEMGYREDVDLEENGLDGMTASKKTRTDYGDKDEHAEGKGFSFNEPL